MPIPPQVVKCYKYIDAQKERYIRELKKIVAIPGISSDPTSHKQISLLIEWMEERLKGLGFDVELREVGTYTPEGETSTNEIPILVLGSLRQGSNKKTLLYYCHLDVADVKCDTWVTNPFVMIERDGKLYGRGTAKMKGPLLCFIHAIEAYKSLGLELPVNVKIFCESMHEVGSLGVDKSLDAIKAGFSMAIDCILINDGQWIGKYYPCIIHGSRGVCYFNLCVEGPKEDMHSGEYGGILYEPLQDVLFIINRLVDDSGRIKIPGFYDNVDQVTPDEEDIYRNIKIDMEDYRKTASLKKLAHDGKTKQTLMSVWRYPTFSLHFIDTNIKCDCPVKLTIPKKVTARFSIRLVSHQYPERVCKLLYRYVKRELRARCTPNNVTLTGSDNLNPWLENHLHWNYKAAKMATKQVYKEEANLIRESDGYPTLLEFRKALPDKNILVLPVINNESRPGKGGENISLRCYIESTKLITNYLHHLSVFSPKV